MALGKVSLLNNCTAPKGTGTSLQVRLFRREFTGIWWRMDVVGVGVGVDGVVWTGKAEDKGGVKGPVLEDEAENDGRRIGGTEDDTPTEEASYRTKELVRMRGET
jgi:hypothetical protein